MKRHMMSCVVTGALLVLLGGSLFAFHAFASGSGTGSHSASATPSINQLAQRALKEGVDLGGTAAPAFSLQDQNGAPVSLASLRGRPTVLTFFDSVCPHADCSLMAQYLNWTARDMGKQSAGVNWVAISVDPWHDTPASAHAFLQSRQVTLPLHYLLGTLTQLTPIWSAYHMQAILQPDSVVIHTTGVYVLDAQVRERLYLDEGFDPSALGGYMRVLLSQSGTLPAPSGTPVSSQPAGTVIQTRDVGGQIVSLTAIPGQYGTYTFIVEAQDAQGTPIQGAAVSIALTMPSMTMTPLDVPLGPTTPAVPGAYQAKGVLTMVGQWQAIVQVKPANGGQPIQAKFVFDSRQ